MPVMKGVVEAISVKELAAPDQYENTHRGNIKIGDDWYSMGAFKNGKAGEIYTKNGLITKGAEIEFMYDVNGTFKNVKKATVTLLKKGQAQSAPQQSSGGNSAPAKKSIYVDNTIGMGVGAAMNQAVHLHGTIQENDNSVDFDFLEKTACQLYRLAEDLKRNAAAGNIAAGLEETAPPAPQQYDDAEGDGPPF